MSLAPPHTHTQVICYILHMFIYIWKYNFIWTHVLYTDYNKIIFSIIDLTEVIGFDHVVLDHTGTLLLLLR